MRRPDPKKPDAITLLAQVSARDRRRRSPIPILLAAALVLAILTLLAWWVWPTARPRQIVLAAYDVIVSGEEEVALRAGVEAATEADAGLSLDGYELHFALPAGQWEAKATTGVDGFAEVSRAFPAQPDGISEILVRCPGTDSRRGSPDGSCRIIHWPADASLLIIDADHTLAVGEEGVLQSSPNLDVRPLPGAVTALRSLAKKYRPVYVSAKADRPALYLKLGAWLKLSRRPADQLPDGPLLAPTARPGGDTAAFWKGISAYIKERFTGPVVAVTRRPQEARPVSQSGMRCILLDDKSEPLERAQVLGTWADVEKLLAK